MNGSASEYVDGTVVRVNERGFQLDGRAGWLNLSKFCDPPPALPTEGAQVRVGLDKAGYVRSIEPAGQAPMLQRDVIAAVGRPAEDRAPYYAGPAAQEAAPEPPAEAAASPADRETCITRMACLNMATAYLAGQFPGVGADLDQVIEAAARLESWVNR